MSERKGKVILCPGTKVCYEESGGRDYQKQSEKYGRVCKVEVEKRGGSLIRVVFKQKVHSASDNGIRGAVKNSLEIIFKQVHLEGGFERGG